MTVEVATYINDLQPVNPSSTDQVSQGDDHLRLIKQVLQNQFSNASRQFQIPSVRTVSASGSIAKSDGNGIIYCATTSGALTLTLPTLAAIDAGWMVNLFKTTSDVNPIFIAPALGNINSGGASVAKARRCIPSKRFIVVWDGANWVCERINVFPIGTMVDFYGTALPAGFEWPNGQTLTSGNYLEYAASYGSYGTPDLRGYAGVVLDNLGGTAAGRLPNGYITSTSLGATGGVDGVILSAAQMPQHYHTVAIADPGHVHAYTAPGTSSSTTGGGGFTIYSCGSPQYSANTTSVGTGCYITSSVGTNCTNYAGSSAVHSNLQPSIMLAKILVVE